MGRDVAVADGQDGHVAEIEQITETLPAGREPGKRARLMELHGDEDEKTALYNAAGKQKNSIPPDLPDYIMEHEYVSAALRTARDLDAGEEEWQRFIDDLRRRKG